MKNIYKYFNRLILGILVFGLSFSSFGQITSYPHNEGFEDGAIPSGWTQEHESASVDWIVTNLNEDNTVVPRTGDGMAHFHSDSYGDITKLVSPQLDLTSLTIPYLSFYYANSPWGTTVTELRMYYKSAEGDSWTQIGEDIDSEHTSWTEINFILPDPSADYYIAFEGRNAYGKGVELDDIVVKEGPTCTAPSNLTGVNATSTSVDLEWTENGDATTWNIEYGTPGFIPGTDDQTGKYVTSTSTYEATFSPGTEYDFYVQADCGGDLSNWNGPFEAYYCGFGYPATSVSYYFFTEITSTNLETNLSYTEITKTIDYIDKTEETFEAREEQTFNIKTTYNDSTYANNVNIWIDWNNDLTFDDSEKVASEENPEGIGTGTASISVPAGTQPGEYRMRVRGSTLATLKPCGLPNYYATIDFNLTILPACLTGENGTLEVCKNEPFDLFDGLSENTDTGGVWYNSSNTALQSSLDTAANTPGEYSYDYIISSGGCPADTLTVVVSVKSSCDYLGLSEELFTDVSVYPNPATSEINIVTPENTSSLTVEMLDMNGRVVLSNAHALENVSGATIAIDHLERGIYTLRVYNESGQNTFKVVKQ